MHLSILPFYDVDIPIIMHAGEFLRVVNYARNRDLHSAIMIIDILRLYSIRIYDDTMHIIIHYNIIMYS